MTAASIAVVQPSAAVARSLRRRPATISSPVLRHQAGGSRSLPELLAAETPVALVYNGQTHSVLMASPADLEDFARGFTLSEAIVTNAADILSIEVTDVGLGLQVDILLPEALAAASEARRGTVGGSACGLCGVLSLERAVRAAAPVSDGAPIAVAAIQAALAALPPLQRMNDATGALHAAAFADLSGRCRLVREDVGRHNALDKLIGATMAGGQDCGQGFLVLTSRCSAEMVQKAAVAGFRLVVAISAPTSLAVELAQAANVTLVAFARPGRFTVYTHPGRIVDAGLR